MKLSFTLVNRSDQFRLALFIDRQDLLRVD